MNDDMDAAVSDETAVRSGRVLALSVQEYQDVLDPWVLTIDQLERGGFRASVEFAQGDHFTVLRESRSHVVHCEGVIPEDFFVFGLPDTDDRGPLVNGVELGANTLGLGAGGATLEAVLPGAASHLELFIPIDMIEELSESWDVDPASFLKRRDKNVGAHDMGALADRVSRSLGAGATHASALADPLARAALDESVSEALFRCLGTDGRRYQPRPSASLRGFALRKAVEYMTAQSPTVSIPEVARAVGVSQRTLQYAFREYMGLTPVSYLRHHRLNAIRRELQLLGPDETTVSETAGRFGVTEPGRFSVRYRRLFGESPSETLRTPYYRPQHSVSTLAAGIAKSA